MMNIIVSYNHRKRRWTIEQEFMCSLTGIIVPKGFVTDLASVPRALWSIVAPFDLSLHAPIIHDFIYKRPGQPVKTETAECTFSRYQADTIFKCIMEQEQIPAWKTKVSFWAVRIFSKSIWARRLK